MEMTAEEEERRRWNEEKCVPRPSMYTYINPPSRVRVLLGPYRRACKHLDMPRYGVLR